MTNEERDERAYRILVIYGQRSDSDQGDWLRELLTDLMHYADGYGHDFATELEEAQQHHAEQTGV